MTSKKININEYKRIVFFTGAGMSAESGVPTYRGSGGIWNQYNWQEYACQTAFDLDPEKVLKFHEIRRKSVLECQPHQGHKIISKLEDEHPHVVIVTQNIDGMHQRAGSSNVIELHGSLWKMRCPEHGISENIGENYQSYTCTKCKNWLRPDIIWFGDILKSEVVQEAMSEINQSDLFISIGTSGVVWPAAGFPEIAKRNKARCVEINPEESDRSDLYDENIRKSAIEALVSLF
jgi:NAD-dependent deacetylase